MEASCFLLASLVMMRVSSWKLNGFTAVHFFGGPYSGSHSHEEVHSTVPLPAGYILNTIPLPRTMLSHTCTCMYTKICTSECTTLLLALLRVMGNVLGCSPLEYAGGLRLPPPRFRNLLSVRKLNPTDSVVGLEYFITFGLLAELARR